MELKNKYSDLNSIDYLLIDSLSSLKQHSEIYNEFLSSLPGVFKLCFSIGWIERVLPLYLSSNKSLYFIFIMEKGDLIGVIPLQLEKKNIYRGKLRRLYFFGSNDDGILSHSLRNFLIPNKNNRSKVFYALHYYLYVYKKYSWDFIDLRYCCEQSYHYDLFHKIFPEAKYYQESMNSYVLGLPSDSEIFEKEFKQKKIKELNRTNKKLKSENEKVKFYYVTVFSELMVNKIASIHKQNSVRKKENIKYFDAVFDDEKKSDILFDLIKYAFEIKACRIYLLEVNNKIISFYLNFHSNSEHICYLTSYDHAYSKYAPSRLLMHYMCATEISEFNSKKINMLPGRTKVKEDYSNKIARNWNIQLVNNRVLSKLKYFFWMFGVNLKSIMK